MKLRILTSIYFVLLAVVVSAQYNISGTVLDGETDEGLIGATIIVKGTTNGAIADFDGSFTVQNVPSGTHVLEISYTGFGTISREVVVSNTDVDLGVMVMELSAVGISEVEVVASIAIDRKTPVAVSTISGDVIAAKVGNQEYPEILRKTPSIYVTKQGGGFGDSRINVRGFNQRNVAVMINGIPVNDMENGWVYWSNWAGLADVTSTMQVQRGLGASKLAISAVGGSINIITNPAKLKSGAVASINVGNDGYLKAALAYNSGLSESGWAFSLQGTHTTGDGYVQGTAFKAWSYYAAVTKQFNDKNMLSLTVLGAPQWHHQRLIPGRFDNISLRTFIDPDDTGETDTNLGRKWNWTWGELDGEEFNLRRNFYSKPKAFLNHYWTISPGTELKTSVYASFGRGGGTGPRGRLRTPGSVFDSFGGTSSGIHDENGHVRFDDIVRYNQGQAVNGWGDAKIQNNGQYVVTEDGRVYYNAAGEIISDNFGNDYDTRDNSGSGFIRRASMNSHNWFGILSTLTTELSDRLTLVAGLDGRYYKGIHYRRLENLLGADAYISRGNINNQTNFITEPSEAKFGNFADPSYRDDDNVLNYWNDGLVNWLGLFAQVEYTTDKVSAFLALSGSNQGFKRIDYFNYLDSDPERETGWSNHLGGTIKGGANYNINDYHNVFFNAGYYSQQPLFDNVYINFVNNLNEDVQNQSVTAFELGYGFRSANFRANVNLYSTVWGNRQFDVSTENAQGQDVLYQFENVDQDHKGLEVEANYRITRSLTLNGMLSLGIWEYASNFTARGTNIDTQEPVEDATIYADGLKVGDAAQTTFSIGANFEPVQGLNIYADYYLADNLYARYDVDDDRFFDPNTVPEIVQLPSYGLVDAGISYAFDFGGTRAQVRFNMNNVLDTDYVSETVTNIADDPSTPNVNEFYDNRGIWGFGRTWNTGVKVWF